MPTTATIDYRKAAILDVLLYGGNSGPQDPMIFTDANGPIDFSAATLRLQIKKNPIDAAPITNGDLSTGGGQIVVSGTSHNVVTVNWPALAPGTYVYDLKAVFNSGAQETYLKGTITVDQNITP